MESALEDVFLNTFFFLWRKLGDPAIFALEECLYTAILPLRIPFRNRSVAYAHLFTYPTICFARLKVDCRLHTALLELILRHGSGRVMM